jgi:hypothetical protein
MASPYKGLSPDKWVEKTRALIRKHPLQAADIKKAVLDAWESIFESRIGKRGIRIGIDIFPVPQLMGAFLHELIPLELAAKYPEVWRENRGKGEKDLVYEPKPQLSIEVKTSSHPTSIFANRSYAQPQSSLPWTKRKDGYYIAVNFEKWEVRVRPRIRLIRFGWLDHSDWKPQKSERGQQASLFPISSKSKLLPIYDMRKASSD